MSTGLMWVVGFLLLRSYWRVKMKSSLVLALGVFAGSIWTLASTVYPSMEDVGAASALYVVAEIMSYVMVSLIFVFIELVKEDRVRSARTYFVGALFGSITFLLVLELAPPVGFTCH